VLVSCDWGMDGDSSDINSIQPSDLPFMRGCYISRPF
jgi:hypothetical protein